MIVKKLFWTHPKNERFIALAVPEDLEAYEWPENVTIVQQVDSRQITNYHVKDLLSS